LRGYWGAQAHRVGWVGTGLARVASDTFRSRSMQYDQYLSQGEHERPPAGSLPSQSSSPVSALLNSGGKQDLLALSKGPGG
jgi:hypothetical protein